MKGRMTQTGRHNLRISSEMLRKRQRRIQWLCALGRRSMYSFQNSYKGFLTIVRYGRCTIQCLEKNSRENPSIQPHIPGARSLLKTCCSIAVGASVKTGGAASGTPAGWGVGEGPLHGTAYTRARCERIASSEGIITMALMHMEEVYRKRRNETC